MSAFPDPSLLVLAMVLLGLIPFIAVIATSFVKIMVILQLIRNALGIQQIPPTMTLNGLAIILTLYIMAPVGIQAFDQLAGKDLKSMDTTELTHTLSAAAEPFRQFLSRYAAPRHREFFLETAKRLWPPQATENLDENHFLILIPAFTVSELTSAFEVGFLLYLPFVAIDLIISNILLAMGMMMVSPMTISLPFKLLLFVMLDGWTRLIQGLVLSYYQ
ncbi:MAG TPA: type III secretion system export apparatus subunit SctR [Candidatus Competibacteraceae bacterium]|nr:MAG: EscR/YscR/HrcR family type III secretion system export apparatus protein [Candidatus Competibacteraceae bacterium]HOB61145.1 type III secretion system export apparatus subunit SctR [Candidatus Competibacteraceae bacterium]HQA24778.1 type III secretion system export apparatus subunit SctR [Candidatus Competibacteraceae bacterium]HQD55468.1 type III secretion system export apparatus subunit SctR [Candidatus Competibacteraceae bacterium]